MDTAAVSSEHATCTGYAIRVRLQQHGVTCNVDSCSMLCSDDNQALNLSWSAGVDMASKGAFMLLPGPAPGVTDRVNERRGRSAKAVRLRRHVRMLPVNSHRTE